MSFNFSFKMTHELEAYIEVSGRGDFEVESLAEMEYLAEGHTWPLVPPAYQYVNGDVLKARKPKAYQALLNVIQIRIENGEQHLELYEAHDSWGDWE